VLVGGCFGCEGVRGQCERHFVRVPFDVGGKVEASGRFEIGQVGADATDGLFGKLVVV